MASRFWVGSSGPWNTSSNNWAATDGGAAGSATAPTSVDTVTFSSQSGGGTVTVASSINVSNSVQSITCGSFTGTLDFSVNNPSIAFTLATSPNFSISGTGTRVINLGSATFTMIGNNGSVWDAATTTNLTLSASLATLVVNTPTNGNTQTFAGGGLTYGTLSIGARNASGSQIGVTGNNTFNTIGIAAPAVVTFANGSAQTISSAFSWNGSSSSQLGISNQGSDSQVTLTCQSGSVISWAYVRGVLFSSGAGVTATNSFDMGRNTNATITPPAVGSGGGFVIGS